MSNTYLLTIKEAAEESRLSEWFIKKEIREGRLLARKFGRATRIERHRFEQWIGRQNVVTAPVDGGSAAKSTVVEVFETKVRNQ